ncbi:MutL, C-terminal, dimerization [Dillenia turbinata]|uniref:MutL, C-terminal, dimerization n=1 Tax=Dillenia turbinata TaxID=194707 RepID=A0AAN8V877_9MAGN
MGNIKPLPRAVHSAVHSSILLPDFTRVLEELILNSLDAAATKVLVWIGVGTCYIKVADNGSGISRDGLVLLGEKHATSKSEHWTHEVATNEIFGFRGQALGSISDVSLLEIITKTHGRPNGYRKGCKCVYLGIDDTRQEVGTTVIVRDLFYNQPVRRKNMQSSPWKVLDAVKKCILRIAFVHSMVSFKLIDVESEDELLCSNPCSSPLALMASNFGSDVTSSLQALEISDGGLKISGYININSRFVSKGPIHKMLNHLADRMWDLDSLKVDPMPLKGKRSRVQACLTYFLNLSCPKSLYELTFEPLKATVVFKDWVPILEFIKKAIMQIWSKKLAHESCSHVAEVSEKEKTWLEVENTSKEENIGIARKRARVHHDQTFVDYNYSSMKMFDKESDQSFHLKDYRNCYGKLNRNTALDEVQETNTVLSHQAEYLPASWDGSSSKWVSNGIHDSSASPASWDGSSSKWVFSGIHDSSASFWGQEDDSFSPRQCKLEDTSTAAQGSFNPVKASSIYLGWGQKPLKVVDKRKISTSSMPSHEHFEVENHIDAVGRDFEGPFLQSCSLQGNLPAEQALPAGHTGFELDSYEFKTQRRFKSGESIRFVDSESSSQSMDSFSRTLWTSEEKSGQPPNKSIAKNKMLTDFDFLSSSYLSDRRLSAQGYDLPFESVSQSSKLGSSYEPIHAEWLTMTSNPSPRTTGWDAGQFTDQNSLDESFTSDRSGTLGHLNADEDDASVSNISWNCFSDKKFSFAGCTNCKSDFDVFSGDKKQRWQYSHHRNSPVDMLLPNISDTSTDKIKFLSLDLGWEDEACNCVASANGNCSPLYMNNEKRRRVKIRNQSGELACNSKGEPRRSLSAPPFCKGKRKFPQLLNCLTVTAGKFSFPTVRDTPALPDLRKSKNPQEFSRKCSQHSELVLVNQELISPRAGAKEMLDDMQDMHDDAKKSEKFLLLQSSHSDIGEHGGGLVSNKTKDSINIGSKWRDNCNQKGDELHNFRDQLKILDINSGILHLAGNRLVPASISKSCLENAKVLQQVDKKFIPIVAGGVLAIIDQHAADERIRLEELRQKVLSGEMKTITHLNTEQELVLPEIGYQLLQNYAEQIKHWGWICNIHAQGSGSCTKNLDILHPRSNVVTLLAVPCILGVNLSDIDLLEFLEQLSDTDGSSVIPPSVLRILNNKACRGAIMFGDSLLPSECTLIVEELKRTSLCFQCAHGRPTTVPLVNMVALQKEITKLGLGNGCGSNDLFHGLCFHEISLERAAKRLAIAKG